ncbi:MAG: alpha/beta hydrolase [Pseudomonadota bacterium]
MTFPHRVEQWRQAGAYAEVGGHRLFFREEGAGDEAIVCFHGFPTSCFDWLPIWDQLTECYRVLTWDLLGFGFSDKPAPHHYMITEQTDLLLELLAQRGIDRAHILSHDYGTILVQELMARAGDGDSVPGLKMDSVTFLNGGLFPEMHRPRLTQRLLLSPLGWLVSRLFTEKKFASAFSEVFGADTKPSEEEIKEFWSLIEFNDGARVNHLLINYMRERLQFRDRWVHGMIDSPIPTILINGLDDPVSGAHLLARARDQMTKAHFVALPGIGHYPQVEAPEAVLDAFLAFIEPLGPSL